MNQTNKKITYNQVQQTSNVDGPDELAQPADNSDKRCRKIGGMIVLCCFIYVVSSHSTNSDTHTHGDLTTYVLPNVTVTVLEEANGSFGGDCIINEIEYEFGATQTSLSFIVAGSESADGVWSGFAMHSDPASRDYDNDTLAHSVIELFATNGSVYSVNITEEGAEKMSLVEMFMEGVLAEHFVELSVKLGSMGYMGSRGAAIMKMHLFAQWIWKLEATKDSNHVVTFKNDEWVDISDEFEKTNIIVLASNNAGFWVETIDDLLLYSSDEHSENINADGSRRSLLWDWDLGITGYCSEDRCNNPCFGMCGRNCDCWWWFCGDCECHKACQEHDYYCSCTSAGMFHRYCMDMTWVSCD